MLQAMFNGVSAIEANQQDMDVIGNNIANVDTTAYKAGSVTFADQLSQTLQGASAGNGTSIGGTNPVQVGLGVKVSSISTQTEQGGLQSTSSPTDMAIQGNGYFMLGSGSGVTYTRDGSFSLDNSGNLVNASGNYVLGWTASTTGALDTSGQITQASHLNVPVGSLQATAPTTNVVYSGNLDADNIATPPATPYSRAVTVYDSLGDAQSVTLGFTPSTLPTTGAPTGAASAWTWTASGATGLVSTPTGTTNQGTIYFDANGKQLSSTGNLSLTPTDTAASPQSISLDFSNVGQISGVSSASASSQDGYAPGTLQSFTVDTTGMISGIFTNGQTRTIGQIALTSFANPSGLEREGNNQFQATVNSGLPQTGSATTGSFGQISTGYLEQSNVDLSTEFTNMIITQNAYSANTKVVSTVNQMLQTLIDMKQ
jgi:flagellar hook protein FlgE